MKRALAVHRKRRRLLAGLAGSLALPLVAREGGASVERIVPVIGELARGAPIHSGRVKLEVPRLAENGHSVPLRVAVESPMSDTDHVRSIHLFSELNPRPVIARFYLGPRAGRAQLATRIRLAGTQRLVAVAELSDGTFWSDVAEVAVTASACLDGT